MYTTLTSGHPASPQSSMKMDYILGPMPSLGQDTTEMNYVWGLKHRLAPCVPGAYREWWHLPEV